MWKYQKNWTKPTDLEKASYFLNFRDRQSMAKFAAALVQAGLKDTGYLDTSDANRLAGRQLEDLISREALVGFNRGRPWQILARPDGTATWTGYDPAQDAGRVWVEEDLLCEQWSTRWEGLKHCRTVFRNPKGSAEARNEFVSFTPVFYYPFSIEASALRTQ